MILASEHICIYVSILDREVDYIGPKYSTLEIQYMLIEQL